MFEHISNLIIYRNIMNDEIIRNFSDISKRIMSGDLDAAEMKDVLNDAIHKLINFSTKYGIFGNLWHSYLAYLIATDENVFSLSCERGQPQSGSINAFARHDLASILQMLHYDFQAMASILQTAHLEMITDFSGLAASNNHNRMVGEKIHAFSLELSRAEDEDALFSAVIKYYSRYGAGIFSLYNSFRVNRNDSGIILLPIANASAITLDHLVGYDRQKKMLVDNTEAFIRRKRANNLLLYGDSGTGKSTCIKAIQNMYRDKGLVVVEINKHQLQDVSSIITTIKARNYRFILVLDDLSFDDSEPAFKDLKALIEGGIEMIPDNVLVYATSNRRHLVKENWSDRQDTGSDDDIHHSDTAEEKISLFNRFGVTIRFNRPSMQEYIDIVIGLAKRHPEINLSDDELIEQARNWGLWHGNISGRRAQQFINHLSGQPGSLRNG